MTVNRERHYHEALRTQPYAAPAQSSGFGDRRRGRRHRAGMPALQRMVEIDGRVVELSRDLPDIGGFAWSDPRYQLTGRWHRLAEAEDQSYDVVLWMA